ALEARAAVEHVRARLQALAALEAASPAWTGEIAALARALPDSAHLRTLAGDSAGLRLAGVARSASAVVPALEASRHFERVSLAAPVRWEQGDAGERFDVAAFRATPGRPR
ncbi:MAG TPA: PilN domain-containing protein, partial [Longimicrobium sp.]|nr:PilN domain-containing protein [Longimicrobium sp.]